MKQTCPVQLVIHWKKNGNRVDKKKKVVKFVQIFIAVLQTYIIDLKIK